MFVLDSSPKTQTVIHLTAATGNKMSYLKKFDIEEGKENQCNCIEFDPQRMKMYIGTNNQIVVYTLTAKKLVIDKKSRLEFSLLKSGEAICFEAMSINKLICIDALEGRWFCYDSERIALFRTDCSGFGTDIQYIAVPEPVKFASFDNRYHQNTFLLVLHRKPSAVVRVRFTDDFIVESFEEVITIADDRITALYSAGKFGNFTYVITASQRLFVLTSMDFGTNFCRAVNSAYKAAGYISDTTTAKKARKPTSNETLEEAKRFSQYFNTLDTSSKTRTGCVSNT